MPCFNDRCSTFNLYILSISPLDNTITLILIRILDKEKKYIEERDSTTFIRITAVNKLSIEVKDNKGNTLKNKRKIEQTRDPQTTGKQ